MSGFLEDLSKLSKQRLALVCLELHRELEARRQSKPEPIAIIGLGCRLPGGVDGPEKFWRVLEEGVDAVGPIPADRWDVEAYYDARRGTSGKMYTRSGGFLDRVDEFDPEFFGISPREARQIDPQHRLVLEVSWEALEHAGVPPDRLMGSRTGVFVGIGAADYATWQSMTLPPTSIDAYTGTGNAYCFASGRLSYLLGVHGPSLALDTACATSLVTVHLACQSLRAGECSLALAGGVNMMISPAPTIFLSQAQALSPDGRCKTFDASADGYGRSEGCGMLVLKRLSDAVAEGDRVLAVIRGSAVNHDGRSSGLTVPNGMAQQAVIQEALAQAGAAPHEIDYVEAHGTGTMLGDPIEVRALAATLGRGRGADKPLWIGAVKTNVGHLEVAAGVTSLIKVVLALRHGTIPRHLHYQTTNPHIAFDEIPARIPVTSVPWPETGKPRLAGVNAFGLSGTNAHVVVEEYRPAIDEQLARDEADADANAAGDGAHVLTLSARDEWSLQALAAATAEAFAPGGMLDAAHLRDVCYTATARRSHHRHRWAAVVRSADDARARLAAVASKASREKSSGRPEKKPGPGLAPTGRQPKLAFVFAGQGPQWWAMGRELMAREPVFLAALAECDGWFLRHGGRSILEELRRDEADSRVADTEIAQPALFALQMALVRLFDAWGVRPDSVIGHSAGEVAAACVAGALSLEDASRLSFHRGRIMQRATGQGQMLAVQLPLVEAESLAARFDGRLSVATINSPSSCVLSGDTEPLARAIAQLEARNVWHRLLPVNYAFHSHQMQGLTADLLEALDAVTPRAATLPIVSTVTGRESDGTMFGARYWVRNLLEPVQFAAGVHELSASGHDTFVEIGPHPVLRKAVVECLEASGREATVLGSLRRGVDERETLLKTIAELYELGCEIDWDGLHPAGGRIVQLPRYPWHRRRLWIDVPASAMRSQSLVSARHDARMHEGNGHGADAGPDAFADGTGGLAGTLATAVQANEHELRWERVERKPRVVRSDESGTWLLLADRRGTAAAVARALRASGAACELVFAAGRGDTARRDEVTGAIDAAVAIDVAIDVAGEVAGDMAGAVGRTVVDATSPQALRELLRSRQAAGTRIRAIVYLWGLDADIDAGAGDAPRAGCAGLLHAIQALAQAGGSAPPLWVITRGTQPVGSTVTRAALAQSPLWGMTRTIPLELPGVSCVTVDLDPDPDAETSAVDALVAELQHWDGVDQLALRGGQRYVPRIHRLTAADRPAAGDGSPRSSGPPLRADGTYVITGGTGAIGLEVAKWMVDQGARHLVLTARSAPSEHATNVVNELTAAGADVRVMRGDIALTQDVERMLADIERTGPALKGIVHAAGIVDPGFIERQPWEGFVTVFAAKFQGAWNLHRLTESAALDFFVLFSSTAAVFGSLGQANYSAANAFLDALAHYRRASGLPALVINWGPWAEIGMAAKQGEQVRQRWELQGVRMMPPAEAIATLADVLAMEHMTQALLISIDWPTFGRVYPLIQRTTLFDAVVAEGEARGDTVEAQEQAREYEALRGQLQDADPHQAHDLVQDLVRRLVAQALGFEPSHPLDPHREFLEMGGDSLTATKVILELNDALDVNLPMSVMFEHPTIAALAGEIVRMVTSDGAEPSFAGDTLPEQVPQSL